MLLVLPASLIGNWQNEIERFAPEMPYQILHKSELKSSEELGITEDRFLYITTYGMALRMEELKDRKWDCLILDEAQAIKNPGTKQTKAIKAIPSRMRIAMTGTPIENRLGDLWSLFDFLNQGLLGSAKEFTEFTKELQDSTTGYAKLRKMIQPFILRRLKTDKTIISDLPDKLEMNAYTTLSKKQIALYKQLLDEIGRKLEETEGIERKGLVLASIMKFKQICNHPDQYLGREEFKAEHSGKFEQLKDICETIRDKRERVLVFTQFKEMTEPLSEYLAGIFAKEGLVLHGETPVKKRKEMVEKFNGESYVPYMVLSLKAGGVGLNLTSANHVIHFDRWWNPAVENQATDRAFRIGQTKNVMVHKFVTRGTVEEKIDEMIAEKQKLSGDILGSGGEQWITEYSNAELMKIFALGGDL
jgi:non-specific serine/threonine protein kinase